MGKLTFQNHLMNTFYEIRGEDRGAGCRVQGAGCRVQGAGCRVQGAGSARGGQTADAAVQLVDSVEND